MKKMYNSLRLLLILVVASNMGALAQTTTFSTVGAHFYTVPAGVTGITVNAKGASGGLNSDEGTYDDRAGHGGCLQAYISVTPGQVLNINVGGCGTDGTTTGGGIGGFNGGGNGSFDGVSAAGGGGGGASDIRVAPYASTNRLVVAGGGGGAGINCGSDNERGGDGGSDLGAGGETGAGCGIHTGGGGGVYGLGSAVGGVCFACTGTAGSPGSLFAGGDGGAASAGGGGGGGFGAAGGGQWSGGGGGSSYYGGTGVTFTSETRGCNTGCGSVAVTVACVVGTISGSNQVCEFATNAPLTETVSGGTWSSSNIAVASVSATGAVTGVFAGTVTITYSLSSLCFTTFPMTVNPAPAAITGIPTLCANTTTTLSDVTLGGTWSSSTTSIATVGSTTGVVSGVSAGTATISFTITSTGCFTILPVLVNPIPLPIVGADTMCSGDVMTVTDATAGGTWSTSSGGVAAIVGAGTSATITAGTAGTSTIGYTLTGTGCAVTMVLTVHALPAGIGGPAHICMGATGTETDITSGGTWSVTAGTGSASIGASTGIVTPISVGTIHITYTLPTSCYITRVVTVEPAVPPITTTSTGEVCIGSSIILADAGTGGTWSSATTTVATVTGTGTVNGVGIAGTGGTSVISYTIGFCAATFTVTVHPRPTAITGAIGVCVGDCSQVYTSGPGAGTWSTSLPGVGTIDPTTGTFCAITAGVTDIIYTFTATGCTRSLTITVNALPATPGGPNHVCKGSSITLSEGSSGTWTSSNSDVTLSSAVGSSTVATGVDTTGADITFVDGNGCSVTEFIRVDTLPNPITLVAGANPMCQGSTATLASVGSDPGTWISSLPAVETINASTGVCTGVFGGVAIDTYKVTATGCYVTFAMTVVGTATMAVPPPATMCIGTSASVLATGGGGAGVWSSSNGGIVAATDLTAGSGTVDAIAAGSATICFTLIAPNPACATCRTVNVLPAIGAITGPNSVCQGSTITLSSTTPGGTWTSVNTTKATVVAGTGVVTGVSTVTAVDTIIYTVGTCQASKIITINPSPAALTTTTSYSICQGLSTTLCTTGPGPGGYTWSSSNTSVGTLSTAGLCATVTGVGAGITTVSYTNNFTGCTAVHTVTVTSGIPAISGPNFVCMGATIVETNTVVGNWSSSNVAVATVTGGLPGPAVTNTTVTPITTGTITLTFASPTGCSATKTISVNPTPSAVVTPLGSTSLCPGGFVDLTASTGTGYTYQWYNGGVIAGATNATYLANSAGNYFVIVSAPAGPCTVTSGSVLVTVNSINPTITASTGTGSPLCASAGLVLTASVASSYQWQLAGLPIVGATNVTFTPTVTGSYTVVESNTFGCIGTSTPLALTFVSSPAGVVTITGALSFCAGGSVNLTADAGTGLTYQWYRGGTPITGATNINYLATVAGTYYVIDVNTAGCSTQSGNVVVTVKPLPVATITAGSSTSFCTGGSVALAAPASATNQFQWYKNGVLITGATSAVYIAGTTGNYTVKVDSPASGCSALSAPKTVTEVTTPTLHLITPSTFCWGGSAVLEAIIVSGAGAVSYQWTNSGVNVPGATNATFAATVSGDYAVILTVGSGVCSTTSATTNVTEKPLPNPLVSYVGTHLQTQNFFVTYQWYYNLAAIAGATSNSLSPIGNGSYKVQVTDTNGCQSISAGFPLTGWVPNGISNPSVTENNIHIYPNPAQDVLHIDAPVTVNAVIIGMDGRTVIDQQSATIINISKLPNGIYTIKLFDTNGQMIKVDKLVKEGN